MTDTTPAAIRRAADLVWRSQHLVAFTGAGISTDSGLPDFRGPDGVWTRRDKGLPPPKARVPAGQVRPNAGHMALVELQQMGKLAFLISQNVDGLHLDSGIEPERLAELHGNSHLMKCLACDVRFTHAEVGWDKATLGPGYRTQRPSPHQPSCPRCSGRLISSVVNFEDPMPERELEASFEHAERADLFVVIGSSLVVSPANDLPRVAVEAGAQLVILNRGQTPLDELADLRIEAGISQVLPEVVRRVREGGSR